MRYGFVIDQTRCIGCHACTVACKEENRVPLGVFRTWVKYVEKGEFPHTRRHFAVLRCNHCDEAPCVTICPTAALYRRGDGIVDFDTARCIGCKSCMQACPYDALYIDPETRTAAKCHFCAHRVERSLEPACVVVCPERAILAGDLDDPGAEVSRVVAREQVLVRKPEQGTRPKVFYVGADDAALTPDLQVRAPATLWGEWPRGSLASLLASSDGFGSPAIGTPKSVEVLGRTVYDIGHEPQPWGWRVSAYLWTKSVAAGAGLVVALGALTGWLSVTGAVLPVAGLVFLAATTALLVTDLKRPERFHYVLLKPDFRSWLVWGAWIVIAYAGILAAWLSAGLAGRQDLLPVLVLPLLALALAAAGYSAFLFGQAEGRDFWQSPLTLPHLLAAAVIAGAALTLLVHGSAAPVRGLLLIGLGINLLLLLAELYTPHAAQDAERAARLISRGPWRRRFWAEVVVLGHLAPALLLVAESSLLAGLAGLLALAGLHRWETCWVEAGQAAPLS